MTSRDRPISSSSTLRLALAEPAPLSPGQSLHLRLYQAPASGGMLEIELLTKVQDGGSLEYGLSDYPLFKLALTPAQQDASGEQQLTLPLPSEAPITLAPDEYRGAMPARLWLHARWGDATRTLPLALAAPAPLNTLLAALGANGLLLTGSRIERGTVITRYGSSSLGCYQVFDFCSEPHPEAQTLDGVSVTFIRRGPDTIVWLEVQATQGGGYRSLRMGEDWREQDWTAIVRQLLPRANPAAPPRQP